MSANYSIDQHLERAFEKHFPNANDAIWLTIDHEALERYPSLRDKVEDFGGSALIQSDELGDWLKEEIELAPEYWFGSIGEDGEPHLSEDWEEELTDSEIRDAIEGFLSDHVSALDLYKVKGAPSGDLERLFGLRSIRTFSRLGALGDYRLEIRSDQFDCIETAREVVEEAFDWLTSEESLDFAAILLACSDRYGLQTSLEGCEEHHHQIDLIFDRWEGLQ